MKNISKERVLEAINSSGKLVNINFESSLDLSSLKLGGIEEIKSVVEFRDSNFLNISYFADQFPYTFLMKNSIINGDLIFHSIWFKRGLILDNCHVKGDFELGYYEVSGIFLMENCKIDGFSNFGDETFSGPVYIRNNHFIGGTNILGFKNIKAVKTKFMVEPVIENNFGNMNSDYPHT